MPSAEPQPTVAMCTLALACLLCGPSRIQSGELVLRIALCGETRKVVAESVLGRCSSGRSRSGTGRCGRRGPRNRGAGQMAEAGGRSDGRSLRLLPVGHLQHGTRGRGAAHRRHRKQAMRSSAWVLTHAAVRVLAHARPSACRSSRERSRTVEPGPLFEHVYSRTKPNQPQEDLITTVHKVLQSEATQSNCHDTRWRCM